MDGYTDTVRLIHKNGTMLAIASEPVTYRLAIEKSMELSKCPQLCIVRTAQIDIHQNLIGFVEQNGQIDRGIAYSNVPSTVL